MVETLKGRTPVSSTFTPSLERAAPLRAQNRISSLFPPGITHITSIEAPRPKAFNLRIPKAVEPNPDRVYKRTTPIQKNNSLMPARVTHIVDIPAPKRTRTVKLDRTVSRPMFDRVRTIKPAAEISKTKPVTFISPSRNLFTATPLQPRFIDTPRPKTERAVASLIRPDTTVTVFPRRLAQESFVKAQPIIAPKTELNVRPIQRPSKKEAKPLRITTQHTPRTELRTAYINQAIISPVTRTDSVRPVPTFEKRAELVSQTKKLSLQEVIKPAVTVETKTVVQTAERVHPTTRTQLKRREISTVQKEQKPHRVAIRESLKHAHTVYENFKAAGLAPKEAYQKSTVALQAAMEKENVPTPVMQRIISVRTRRLHLKLERRTAITVLRRSEIILKSRKFTKKDEASVKQKEHTVRPVEMILIEDIPTKKLRELIFNQVIENLPGKSATWYDVVRGVMEHPWMPKMNSPLLYNIYPHHIISKYLVDGLLLHRLREWLKIKEPQTKENLKNIVKDILDITPAVTVSLKKPNSPIPLNEEIVDIIVKGDKTEPKVERRNP